MFTKHHSFTMREDSHDRSRLFSNPDFPHFLESPSQMQHYLNSPAHYHLHRSPAILQNKKKNIHKMTNRLRKMHQ